MGQNHSTSLLTKHTVPEVDLSRALKALFSEGNLPKWETSNTTSIDFIEIAFGTTWIWFTTTLVGKNLTMRPKIDGNFQDGMREFKKYIEWRGNSYGGDQLYANARRVFKGFFTPAGVYLLRFLNRVCPYFSRIMFQLTANLAMRWIVDCDIVYDKTDKTGKTQLVETCGFRKSLGESACVKYCKIPTERFMKEEIGMNLTLNPGEGLSCKFCSGVSAVGTNETQDRCNDANWSERY